MISLPPSVGDKLFRKKPEEIIKNFWGLIQTLKIFTLNAKAYGLEFIR